MEIHVITNKADKERNAVTSSGLMKLKLLMVQGTINFDTVGEVTNLQLPEFSVTFAEILRSPPADCAQMVQSLLHRLFSLIRLRSEKIDMIQCFQRVCL